MDLLLGSALTVALVILLVLMVRRPDGARVRDVRGATYMLLIGVPALVIQTDLTGIAALSGMSMVLFEVVALALAL